MVISEICTIIPEDGIGTQKNAEFGIRVKIPAGPSFSPLFLKAESPQRDLAER